jgi:cell division transport system permease protein
MAGWHSIAAADRRLLADDRLRGPTPYVIAIMTFAMIIVAAAGLALANAAGIVARGVESRYAVQVADPTRLPEVLGQLRADRAVSRISPVPQAEMRRTLEQWLGPGALAGDLPVPALVTFDVAASQDADRVARQIERALPGAKFVAHDGVVAPLLKSLQVLQWLALALVLMMALATAAAVVLAARGAFDTHRTTIDVMHGLGATDRQVTQLFQRKIAVDALIGAAGGTIAATLILLVLAGSAGSLAGDIAGGPPLAAIDLLILLTLPIAAVALAAGVARGAVMASLRKSL